MKKTKMTVALAGLMIASAVVISSCSKKKTTTTTPPAQDTNASTASDNNMSEQYSNDVETMGAEGIDNGSLSTFRLANGGLGNTMGARDSVTHVTGSGVYAITFTNDTCADGHVRNGTIVYTINPATAHYRDANMSITVATSTVSPYTVDGNTVTIAKTITNQGILSGVMTWSITSTLTITKASGGTFTWNANRTHALLNTSTYSFDGTAYNAAYNGTTNPITWAETPAGTPNGAIIQINGTASGSSADGVAYNVTMSNVVRNMNCSPISTRPHFHPFVAGTITFTPSGKTARIINFGTGSCDATYTISIGSWSETLNW